MFLYAWAIFIVLDLLVLLSNMIKMVKNRLDKNGLFYFGYDLMTASHCTDQLVYFIPVNLTVPPTWTTQTYSEKNKLARVQRC